MKIVAGPSSCFFVTAVAGLLLLMFCSGGAAGFGVFLMAFGAIAYLSSILFGFGSHR
jgi:hypothetical protein